MMTRLTHYISALIFLMASMVVYENTFVPWIEPDNAESIDIKPPQSLRVDGTLKDIFADGSWQRGACKCLQTAEGMLLFEQWEQTAADQWKLWPITVVMGRGMSSKKSDEPMILEAAEGAEIKFSDSLDVMSGGAPPIERGRMIGSVHVYRQKSMAAGGVGHADPRTNASRAVGRDFDLRTSNVGIDKRKLWTTDAINMQVGDARLVGSDLTLHFAGDPTKSKGDPRSILDRMELVYLDELTLPLNAAKTNVAKTNAAKTNVRRHTPQGVVKIGCKGRVEYDFAIDQLMMRDNVTLVHQLETGIMDQFRCDRLQLWLNDPTNDSIDRSSPMSWLNRLVAQGNQEQNLPAEALLPSFDASIVADEILLDARAGKVLATGENGIRLERGVIWAGLSSLEYDFDPRNPEAIGTLTVNGAGVVKISDPNIAVRKAQWRNRMQVKPRGVSSFDDMNADVDINVDQEFHAWFVDGGEFQADSIHAILTPDTNSPAPNSSTLSAAKPSLVPSEFNVTGNVVVNTSAIVAETDFLRLLFVGEADPAAKKQNGQPAPTSPLRQWVSQPTAGQPLEAPVARARPVLRGNSIQAVLRRNSTGLSAKSLQVDGDVQVTHTLQTEEANMPVQLSADKLRLLDGAGDDVLELTSSPEKPARFDIGDGFFVGRTIQVRPSENMIWIPEAGEFQIPTDVLPTSIAEADNGNGGRTAPGEEPKIQWVRPPYCRWQGEMTFDGHAIVLTEGVDISATMLNGREPWEFQMQGDQLKVNLWEDVSLVDFGSMRSATVQSISLLKSDGRPVMVQALQRAADGVLQSKHLLRAAQLTMFPGNETPGPKQSGSQALIVNGKGPKPNQPSRTGMLVGSGPGWYRGWMPSQQSDTMNSDSSSSMIDDAERPLTGIHLTFNDQMQAEMESRVLNFSRGVRVGVQAVGHWEETFSADQMDNLGVGETTLDCEQLRLSVEATTPNRFGPAAQTMPWEVQAISGIVLRTRSERGLLETTASRAAYAASKDLFTLQGSPSRPAVIKQFLPDGSPRFNAAVRSAVIRPRSMTIDSMEVHSVNMATPAGIAKPKPGSYR